MGLDNKKKLDLAIVVGTRPNFVKAAPLFNNKNLNSNFNLKLIYTGQHFSHNLAGIFFKQLGLPKPTLNIEILDTKHNLRLGQIVFELYKHLKNVNYAGVIVIGDVDSTLAAAIATKQANLPLIHLEAGLRSFDRRMPEEFNRLTVDHLSDLLLVSEPSGLKNLKSEKIVSNKINYVGNIMIESLIAQQNKINKIKISSKLKIKQKKYLVATIHRFENLQDKKILIKIIKLLTFLSKDYQIILPLHPNTQKIIRAFNLENYLNKFKICEPLDYFAFQKLIKHSAGVITDSGGIQEETTYLKIPCCTLRDNTERPITLTKGSNLLFSLEKDQPVKIIAHLKKNFNKLRPIKYWDNQVTDRINKALEKFYKII